MSRSRRSFFRWVAGIISLALVLTTGVACRGLLSQDPKRIFADGKMPAMLEKLANQILELRDREGILRRIQEDQKRKDLLTVAVIDNGVEITHPDLVNKIAFDVKDGKIVGAGYDVMGKDHWGSPQLIDPSLFAFGAQAVQDGKIVGPPANPLDLLNAMNSAFFRSLQAKIAADPALASSFYGRLNETNFTIIGARGLLKDDDFNPEKLAKRKERLIKAERPQIPDGAPDSEPVKNAKAQLETWIPAFHWKLQLDLESGLPLDLEYNMTDFEHAEKFGKVLKEAYDEVDAKMGFTKAFKNYTDFLKENMGENGSSLDREAPKNLLKALAFKKWGPKVFDPLQGLNERLRMFVLRKAMQKDVVNFADLEMNERTVSAVLDELFDWYAQKLNELSKVQTGFNEQLAIKTNLEALPRLKALKEWYLRQRGWEKTTFFDDRRTDAKASEYRRYLWRTSHPFLSSGSASTSHGTHVSGIVSSQDERIRIFPVRVLTQGVSLSESEKWKIAQDFQSAFKEWLKNPLISEAVSHLVAPVADALHKENLKSKNPDVLAETLAGLMEKSIQTEVMSSPTNYVFIKEVQEAIKVVGERKIKVANISLGAEFEYPVIPSLEGTDPAQAVGKLFQFLKFEFWKYQIAQEVQRSASKTIFVIAGGNSGKWVDGRSQSALPVDLSSPFLAKFEKPAEGKIAPNNGLKNVIGVGSLSTAGELSSYMNILISKRTPFVMAEGEEVYSSVRQTDLSGIEQINQRNLSLLKGLPSIDVEKDYSDRKSVIESLLVSTAGRAITELTQAVNIQLALEYGENRARMSGTSMASPTVAGLIAREIILKAVKLGVSPEALYDHPEFRPSEVIERVMTKAEVMKGDLFIPLKKLAGHLRHQEGAKIQTLQQRLSQFREGKLGALSVPLCRQVLLK
jgi:hypothetical protein